MWVWAWVGVWRRLHLLVVSTLAGGRLSCPAPQVQNCSRSARNSARQGEGARGGTVAVRARSTPHCSAGKVVRRPLGIRSAATHQRPPVGNGSRGRSWTRLTTQQAFNALMIAYVPLGSVTGLVNPWVVRRETGCGGRGDVAGAGGGVGAGGNNNWS